MADSDAPLVMLCKEPRCLPHHLHLLPAVAHRAVAEVANVTPFPLAALAGVS